MRGGQILTIFCADLKNKASVLFSSLNDDNHHKSFSRHVQVSWIRRRSTSLNGLAVAHVEVTSARMWVTENMNRNLRGLLQSSHDSCEPVCHNARPVQC
jgi:hypothetical protein